MGATASVNSEVIMEKSVEKSVVKSVNEVAFKNATAVVEAADVDSVAKLDSFAKEMFIRSPKVEGLNHLLLSHHGREAFMKFLRNEYAEANLWFYMAVDEIKRGIFPDEKELAEDMEVLVSTYLSPDSDTKVYVTNELRMSLERMISGEILATQDEMLGMLIQAQDQAIQIMATGAFPRFLLSEDFQEWRETEKDSAMSLITAQAESEGTGLDDHKISLRLKMSKELDRVLGRTSWLTGLLSSIESLPVCVSLAAASENIRGFPLIYVNAAFEATTGYERIEIIGQNCRFLQNGKESGHTSEVDSIARLSQALRDAKSVRVAITNFRKDGTPFRNLLAMKPIMDQDGRYAFVIGIQFDIGNKDATPKKMKMIDDLFRVLPDVVFTNPPSLT